MHAYMCVCTSVYYLCMCVNVRAPTILYRNHWSVIQLSAGFINHSDCRTQEVYRGTGDSLD